jgi:hypothetical protein
MTVPVLSGGRLRRTRGRSHRRPARARHPWHAETCRGIAPWAAVTMFLTLLVPVVAKTASWQGSWALTQSELHTVAAVLGGPLAAAAGCWQGGRERRTGMVELRLSGPRSPLAQFLVAVGPVVSGVLAAYAFVAAGTELATWPYVSAGRPLLAPLVSDAVFLAAMTVGGVVAGRIVRWRLAAPALAVCAYVALGLPLYQDWPARYLSPAVVDGVGDQLPVSWQPLAMAVWTGGLAAALALAYSARRHRYAALLPLAAAVAAAVPLVRTGDAMWHPDPAGRTQVCAGSAPRVCVNALNAKVLPDVTAALSGLTGRLEGVGNVPAAFEDLHRRPKADEAELPDLSLGQSVVRGGLADPEAFVWEAASQLVTGHCDAALTTTTDDAVRDWLASNSLGERRLAGRRKGAEKAHDERAIASFAEESRAATRLAGMDGDQRRAWLSRYFASVDQCGRRTEPKL